MVDDTIIIEDDVEAVRIDENGDTQMNGGLIVEGTTTLRGQTTIGNSFGHMGSIGFKFIH
jgi:hypothetical protein